MVEYFKCSGYLGDCEHPESNEGMLPLTSEYFYNNSASKTGFKGYCKVCSKKQNDIYNNNRNDISRRKYPTPHDKCVYAIKEGNEIVYIGESNETSNRLRRHLRTTGDTGSVFYGMGLNRLEIEKRFRWHILWYGDNDEYRKSQEKELIELHQPKYNKTWKRKES